MENKVTLVGAGLVGSLLSLFLARRGHDVEVFERRPDMRENALGGGRSINLAVSTRGLKALSKVGLENEVLKLAIPMRGRMIHSMKGDLTFQRYGVSDAEHINSVSRSELNKLLMTEAEKTGRVKINFLHRAMGIDLGERQALHLQNERTGEKRTIQSPLVIGTDGSASAIRQELVRKPGARTFEDYLEYGYKELIIPLGAQGSFQMEKGALHIWPRGTFMLIALPNLDGSFTATLFLPHEGPLGFDKLKDRQAILQFFKEYFPDVVPLMPDLAETFLSHPTGHMVTVKCSPWHHTTNTGATLLMGDAAHAIVPFFGQGMNCGFEDCAVFDGLLENQASWAEAFQSFFRARKANADAIADMAVENFIEMRDKVGTPRFLLEKGVEQILQKHFPSDYISRYRLVTFSATSYEVALKAGVIQTEILGELCQGIEKPENVDIARAERLIRSKLSPYLKEQQVWI